MTTTKTKMTKTTTDPQSMQRRLSLRRAVSAVAIMTVLVVVSACTSTDDANSGDDSSSPTTSQVEDSATTTVAVDARVLLASALDRYENGYRFEAVAKVGDEEAATITGFVIGESAQMDVTSGDGTVTYVITPDASWIRVDDGDWVEVEADGPIEPPLDALAAPDTITIVATNDDGIVALGAYDGANFGSDGTVELNLRFADGLLVAASYTTGDASVSTSFAALDGETIEDPTASGQ
ncbi:MAG: hypothetical protein BMS9Abin12_0119 [Acidimicrobiia bacterium]|nr:MAG: hypothetical protein BMS9Abin12_0119 [Acidimicrobiia bacterium]